MRVGLRCDASPALGVGHLMRCLALAAALLRSGAKVTLLGTIDRVPWLRDGIRLPMLPGESRPDALALQARALALDAMVLDSYELPAACAGAVRDAGVVTLAIVDGDTRGQRADLYLDQNLGAELEQPDLPAGAVRLAGLRYALVRPAVTSRRPAEPRPARNGTPRVLCFFGGTDAYGAAPLVARLLVATDVPFDATVVVSDGAALPGTGQGQSLTAIAAGQDLPALVQAADVVVSAAGTSTWELLCLGAPAALVRVVENQRIGYDRTVARGLAVGLGDLADLHETPEPGLALRRLLIDTAQRAALSARGWAEVDGLGATRVADALLHARV